MLFQAVSLAFPSALAAIEHNAANDLEKIIRDVMKEIVIGAAILFRLLLITATLCLQRSYSGCCLHFNVSSTAM